MTLKAYRKAIGDVWLPITGRRRLTSYEYEFTKQLFDSQTSIEVVLKAIQTCADRARSNNKVLYSIGVITPDIEAMKKKKADSQVGAQSERDWRKQWADDLAILVEEETNPIFQKIYSRLLSDLPELTEDQAKQKWQMIQAKMREMSK